MLHLIPLAPYVDLILLIIRIVAASIMLYFGIPKAKNPKKNAKEFEHMGFKPGMIWGSITIVTEILGGIALILGIWVWFFATLIAIEMLTGVLWKIFKTNKGFRDYSYDLLILGHMLVLLAFGTGKYALGNI